MKAAVILVDLETGEADVHSFGGTNPLAVAAEQAPFLQEQHPNRHMAVVEDLEARQAYARHLVKQLATAVAVSPRVH